MIGTASGFDVGQKVEVQNFNDKQWYPAEVDEIWTERIRARFHHRVRIRFPDGRSEIRYSTRDRDVRALIDIVSGKCEKCNGAGQGSGRLWGKKECSACHG